MPIRRDARRHAIERWNTRAAGPQSARELAGEIARQLARFFQHTPTIAVLAGKLDRLASGKLKDFT